MGLDARRQGSPGGQNRGEQACSGLALCGFTACERPQQDRSPPSLNGEIGVESGRRLTASRLDVPVNKAAVLPARAVP